VNCPEISEASRLSHLSVPQRYPLAVVEDGFRYSYMFQRNNEFTYVICLARLEISGDEQYLSTYCEYAKTTYSKEEFRKCAMMTVVTE
jgi:hypothetical protein